MNDWTDDAMRILVAFMLALLISLGAVLIVRLSQPEDPRTPALLLLSDYDTGQGTIYVRFMDGLEYHDIPITGGRDEAEAVKRHIQEATR
jgi:hypothetical protein